MAEPITQVVVSLTSPGLRRIVLLPPAFDRRNSDPSKNYGIHGVELRMVVAGEDGATQFVVFTNWMLPEVTADHQNRPCRQHSDGTCGCDLLTRPLAADLGYHRRMPSYAGQSAMAACEWLNGADCYYDGSGLNAERVFNILLREGDEGVWRELEAYYRDAVLSPTEV